MRREINLALAASGAGGKRIFELVAGTKNSRLQLYHFFVWLLSLHKDVKTKVESLS